MRHDMQHGDGGICVMESSSDEYWTKDLLGRRLDAEFLYSFLIGETTKRIEQKRSGAYVLNVDAEWGGGKTFFLEGLGLDLEKKGHLVARINAWRDDYAPDPYVAIMAAIEKAFAPFIKKPGKIEKAWTATKASGGAIAVRMGGAVLKGLIKKHTGVSVDELIDIAAGDDNANDGPSDGVEGFLETITEAGLEAASGELEKLVDASLEVMIKNFSRTDEAMVEFRLRLEKAIASLTGKKKAPLFILIDELDRCRPTYAVQLLERVKHLFDVQGVVFVFATNSGQLQHSVSGAYGANFDGFRYLKRFFDRTYVFQEPKVEDYIKFLLEHVPTNKIRAPENALVETLATGCKAFRFDLRAIGHVVDMIDAAATAWRHRFKIDIAILFPVCANFYLTHRAEWPNPRMEQLKEWKLVRFQRESYEGVVDRSIHLGDAYGSAVGIFNRMDDIRKHAGSRSSGPTYDHVYGVFQEEWNGISVERDQPSVQTEILALVVNAGKLGHILPAG